MRRLLAVAVLLALCAACLAEDGDLAALVRARGFDPAAAPNKGSSVYCDLALSGEDSAVMTWSDAAQAYTASGPSDALSQLYLDALESDSWESCRFMVGGEARLSFGAVSARRCDTLGEYAAQVRAALEVRDFAKTFSVFTRSYVLNRRSKKFHFPECPGIRNMSPRNREDFTGTRDALIAEGYSPCGICKP